MSNNGHVLDRQVAIVTGSSAGIGEAVVKAIAEAGASVVVNYGSNEAAALKIVADIEAAGGEAIAIGADVGSESQVIDMFKKTIKAFGTVHILVNNAGLQRDAPFMEMSLAEWQKVINVNLTGQFLCAREAAKEFIRRGVDASISCAAGKIICMSSVHQVIPWSGHCNYAASKGGVMMMMKSIAQEMAPHGIRVNSIAPGAIKTRINHDAWATPEAEAELLKLIPYQRVGTPQDIAKAAVWLASDESDYINGTTLFVDGGMTLYPGFSTGG